MPGRAGRGGNTTPFPKPFPKPQILPQPQILHRPQIRHQRGRAAGACGHLPAVRRPLPGTRGSAHLGGHAPRPAPRPIPIPIPIPILAPGAHRWLPVFCTKADSEPEWTKAAPPACNNPPRECLQGDSQFGPGLEGKLLQHLHSASYQSLASCCRSNLSALENENELDGIFCLIGVLCSPQYELLVYTANNSTEHEGVLPRLGDKPRTSFVSPALIRKVPMHEIQGVPENQINVSV